MAKWDIPFSDVKEQKETAYRRGVVAGLEAALFLVTPDTDPEFALDLNELAQKAKKGLPPI